jgi:hypothetical protein
MSFPNNGFGNLGVPAGMQQGNAGQQQIQGGYWNPGAAPMGAPPPSAMQQPQGQPEYVREPAYPPMLIFKRGCYYVPKFYGFRFGGNGVNASAQTPVNIPFTKDTQIFFRTASAFLADNGDLPLGRTPLSCVQLKISRSYTAGSDSIDVMQGGLLPSAECLYGNGGLPGFFLGNGLLLTTGSYVLIECTTLLNNMQVDVVFGVLEQWTMGTANY